MIFVRQRDDIMAIQMAAILALLPVTFNQSYTILSQTNPLAVPLSSLSAILLLLLVMGIWVLLYTFPDGQFVPHRVRPVFFIPFSLAILAITTILSAEVLGITLEFENTTGEILFTASFLLFISSMLVGIASQIYRYRKVSTALQRQQTKLILYALIVFLLWWIIPSILPPPETPRRLRII